MTQEEKAKAYDRALERARVWKDKSGMPKDKQGILDDIFPELREPEDEKIRKAILELVRQSSEVLDKQNQNNMIAWLEKQHTDPHNGVCFYCYGHRWSMCARDNGIEIVMDGIPVRNFSYKDCEQTFGGKSALEAINEVKVDNANKVESRFHEGEWISGYYTNYKVAAINSKGYAVEDTDGNKINILFENEKFHHLWTIKDVKDGDVLQLGNVTAIFQEYIGNGNCKCYCSVCNGEFEVPSQDGADNSYGCHNAIPATKEQRDLLFKKMIEAGYEWDAEMKELKKMKVTSSTYCSENCKGYQETGKCFADGECDSKRKYDNMLDSCEIEHIEHGKYYYCIKDYYAGGNKRASKGDIVPAKRGMSMMALGAKANEYFLPVNNINVIERLESTNETL